MARLAAVVADVTGGQRLQVAVLLIALFLFGLGFFIYDRRHPEVPRRQPPPPPKLDPDLPARPRPYIPAPLRPGGSRATTPPPLLVPEHQPEAPPYEPPFHREAGEGPAEPPASASTPAELGLVMPPEGGRTGEG